MFSSPIAVPARAAMPASNGNERESSDDGAGRENAQPLLRLTRDEICELSEQPNDTLTYLLNLLDDIEGDLSGHYVSTEEVVRADLAGLFQRWEVVSGYLLSHGADVVQLQEIQELVDEFDGLVSMLASDPDLFFLDFQRGPDETSPSLTRAALIDGLQRISSELTMSIAFLPETEVPIQYTVEMLRGEVGGIAPRRKPKSLSHVSAENFWAQYDAIQDGDALVAGRVDDAPPELTIGPAEAKDNAFGKVERDSSLSDQILVDEAYLPAGNDGRLIRADLAVQAFCELSDGSISVDGFAFLMEGSVTTGIPDEAVADQSVYRYPVSHSGMQRLRLALGATLDNIDFLDSNGAPLVQGGEHCQIQSSVFGPVYMNVPEGTAEIRIACTPRNDPYSRDIPTLSLEELELLSQYIPHDPCPLGRQIDNLIATAQQFPDLEERFTYLVKRMVNLGILYSNDEGFERFLDAADQGVISFLAGVTGGNCNMQSALVAAVFGRAGFVSGVLPGGVTRDGLGYFLDPIHQGAFVLLPGRYYYLDPTNWAAEDRHLDLYYADSEYVSGLIAEGLDGCVDAGVHIRLNCEKPKPRRGFGFRQGHEIKDDSAELATVRAVSDLELELFRGMLNSVFMPDGGIRWDRLRVLAFDPLQPMALLADPDLIREDTTTSIDVYRGLLTLAFEEPGAPDQVKAQLLSDLTSSIGVVRGRWDPEPICRLIRVAFEGVDPSAREDTLEEIAALFDTPPSNLAEARYQQRVLELAGDLLSIDQRELAEGGTDVSLQFSDRISCALTLYLKAVEFEGLNLNETVDFSIRRGRYSDDFAGHFVGACRLAGHASIADLILPINGAELGSVHLLKILDSEACKRYFGVSLDDEGRATPQLSKILAERVALLVEYRDLQLLGRFFRERDRIADLIGDISSHRGRITEHLVASLNPEATLFATPSINFPSEANPVSRFLLSKAGDNASFEGLLHHLDRLGGVDWEMLEQVWSPAGCSELELFKDRVIVAGEDVLISHDGIRVVGSGVSLEVGDIFLAMAYLDSEALDQVASGGPVREMLDLFRLHVPRDSVEISLETEALVDHLVQDEGGVGLLRVLKASRDSFRSIGPQDFLADTAIGHFGDSHHLIRRFHMGALDKGVQMVRSGKSEEVGHGVAEWMSDMKAIPLDDETSEFVSIISEGTLSSRSGPIEQFATARHLAAPSAVPGVSASLSCLPRDLDQITASNTVYNLNFDSNLSSAALTWSLALAQENVRAEPLTDEQLDLLLDPARRKLGEASHSVQSSSLPNSTIGGKRRSSSGEFIELSQYRPGDDFRQVNHNASARSQKIMVNRLGSSSIIEGRTAHVHIDGEVFSGRVRGAWEGIASVVLRDIREVLRNSVRASYSILVQGEPIIHGQESALAACYRGKGGKRAMNLDVLRDVVARPIATVAKNAAGKSSLFEAFEARGLAPKAFNSTPAAAGLVGRGQSRSAGERLIVISSAKNFEHLKRDYKRYGKLGFNVELRVY